MTRRQSKKSFEQGMAFQASLKLGEEWKFEARESPDFIVTAPGARFGLEVTQCQIDARGRNGSKIREAESARQAWLDAVRSEYEGQGGASLNLKYWGSTTPEARPALLNTLFANDFAQPAGFIRIEREGDRARILAFETPNTHWEMPDDRAGEPSRDSAILQRVIDKKAGRLPIYRRACADVRLLVIADQIYNSGRLRLERDYRPHLNGFNAVYFFAYPRDVMPFYAFEAT